MNYPTNLHQLARMVACLLVLVGLVAPALADDQEQSVTHVQLRSTLRVGAEQSTLTLGDLARVSGPQDAALKELTISSESPILSDTWSKISIDSIREQIKNAAGINAGAVVVQGGSIELIRRTHHRVDESASSDQTPKQHEPMGPTLQDQIEQWIIARLKGTAEGTRFRFQQRDLELLSTPTSGRIVEIRELGRSKEMAIGIVLYEHERVLLDSTVRVEVLIERHVRVSTAQIRRKTPIESTTSRVETRWVAPTEPIADPMGSLGQVARSNIDPGTMLIASMLEAPIVVRRGQIVNATSISGSVSVSMQARARGEGKIGEIIELESRDRTRRFSARIAAPGRVVIIEQAAESASTP